MGTIINFSRREHAESAVPVKDGGRILMFTGVRYERAELPAQQPGPALPDPIKPRRTRG